MKILALNSGSSSIKTGLFEMPEGLPLAPDGVEQIGPDGNHGRSFERVLEGLRGSMGGVFAIGHRVVHGGERFREAVAVDEETLEAIRSLSSLARLHNPINVLGIEVARRLFPGVVQVAVFDTAFHQTLPPVAFRYALPAELYTERRIRRFGFHGTSHAFVSRRAAAFLRKAPEEVNLVTLHLGNGASAAAVRGGQSVDTSMGMTPLEGLVMGSRSGDLDPSIAFHLMRETGASADEVERLLQERSGLLGLAGSADMREVVTRAERGDEAARLAIDISAYRIKKYVGAYVAVLGRVDAVVFTGGIGENRPEIRARSLSELEVLGIEVDEARNGAVSREEREIGARGAPVAVLVIPTNEELEIATQTLACLERGSAPV